MAQICCLAGLERSAIPLLRAALRGAGEEHHAVVAAFTIRDLGRLQPDLLIGDIDLVDDDKLERLRQVRFVVPRCVIAIYTGDYRRAWGLATHIAGANCLLAKGSSQAELAVGIHDALSSGCYTDPRFVA